MQPQASQDLYVLADHLNAVLASCGDLLNLPEQSVEPALLCTSLRVLELSTILHLLQARQRAKELSQFDPRLSSETSRFFAATARVPEMAKNFGNSSGDFFCKPRLPDTPSARAKEYRCEAARFGVEAALAKCSETSELWQTLQNSYARLAAMEEIDARPRELVDTPRNEYERDERCMTAPDCTHPIVAQTYS